MATETERKFLVLDDSYKAEAYDSLHTVQGYLCADKGRTVRVRIMGNKGFITIKGSSNESGLSRFEWEKEISTEDAADLMKLSLPGVIDKTRHFVRCGKHIFEVDEFHGDNEGLTVAEVELQDENEEFGHPSWLGKEVTADHRYYNSALSANPFCMWKNNR